MDTKYHEGIQGRESMLLRHPTDAAAFSDPFPSLKNLREPWCPLWLKGFFMSSRNATGVSAAIDSFLSLKNLREPSCPLWLKGFLGSSR
jgi:hypothetical protein